jgi:glyoxylase-like metal-dependent hydrolase (beta-lactamase superfamily II)
MRITLVGAHNPGRYTGQGNNTYLLGGPEAVLIDAGTGHPAHLDELEAALARHEAALSAVLVTHAHVDHASGAPAIAARWPGARFLKMPWVDRDAAYPVAWVALADGEGVVVIDRATGHALEALHTPGHAPDHLAFWDAQTRTLFGGDLAMQGGSIVIPASHGGDVAAYLASLRRVMALDADRLLPAHGPAIDGPRDLLARCIQHREEREAQILAAVRSGHRTLESIADNVYDGLAEALRAAARDTVLAHLIKLDVEGKVARIADEWQAMSNEQ